MQVCVPDDDHLSMKMCGLLVDADQKNPREKHRCHCKILLGFDFLQYITDCCLILPGHDQQWI